MDYNRKKRWIRYNHIKCKMYLHSDFHYECAYCRVREKDCGIQGEDFFEKDHFIARSSDANVDFDAYENLIYACSKCNGTKSNRTLGLHPCRDDIYSGLNPHVRKLGQEAQYQLIANTAEGQRYIDLLQLNSKYYREMRERQERTDRADDALRAMIDQIAAPGTIPEDFVRKLRMIADCNPWLQSDEHLSNAIRCGKSEAGRAFQEVLGVLDEGGIPYELLLEDQDIDVKLQYGEREYWCEIKLNDTAVKPVKSVRMNDEQVRSWRELEGSFGVLHYYIKTGRLELYRGEGAVEPPICLKAGN